MAAIVAESHQLVPSHGRRAEGPGRRVPGRAPFRTHGRRNGPRSLARDGYRLRSRVVPSRPAGVNATYRYGIRICSADRPDAPDEPGGDEPRRSPARSRGRVPGPGSRAASDEAIERPQSPAAESGLSRRAIPDRPRRCSQRSGPSHQLLGNEQRTASWPASGGPPPARASAGRRPGCRRPRLRRASASPFPRPCLPICHLTRLLSAVQVLPQWRASVGVAGLGRNLARGKEPAGAPGGISNPRHSVPKTDALVH